MRRWLALAGVAGLTAAGCGTPAPPADQAEASPAAPPDQEPPVPLNPDSPIQYPPRLYDQKVEGDVVLRLFVDSMGRLVAESSKVAESSGYSALDSAALSGAKKLRFAPARRRGLAVATAFLQPIEFRRPTAGGAAGTGKPDSSAARRPAPPPTPAPLAPPSLLPRTRPDTSPARGAPPRVLPDTTGARRDTAAAPRDTGGVRRDTSKAKADSGAGPH
ncbi:MAG: hypothetical protein AUH78_14985 [Gemmatimonadetes bacterium 13_1_40CM_4_69_8]|nr:MAG: hypothetical protein AUH78_14985 [Gemmatimonadetes bacterium 13_1_40CM_4_69_8]